MEGRFVSGKQIRTEDAAGYLYRGVGEGPHPAVLVVHGSGGAGGCEREYAALLAEHGYTAFCVEYFDAPGVRDALVGVPLEEFRDAADWLLDRRDVTGEQVGVVGFSRGGEAALLIGSAFDSVGAVAAYVPSGYAWTAPSWMDSVDYDQPSWTLNGEPVPFVRIDHYMRADDDVGAPEAPDGQESATGLALDRAAEEEVEAATIAVERIDGPVLLVSGGSDRIWPSDRLASVAADRLDEHDHSHHVEHRSYPNAGHAIRVPYRLDKEDDPAERHQFGGTHAANARASADAWEGTLSILDDGI